VKACGVQLDIAWEDKPANFARVEALLRAAAPTPGSLIVLPEMFATGFSMNVAAIAEEPGGRTGRFLSDLARATGCVVLAGVVTKGASGRGRNEAVACAPDGAELGRFCKLHPFTLGGEADHYERGAGPVLFPWGGFNVAPFVCYDLRFPEVFRIAATRGANLFVVIASWPVTRVNHWIKLLQARAIENLAWVIGVNRAGVDPRYTYPGRSLVVNPQGEIVADAGNREGVIQTELDPAFLENFRRDFPALADLRSEFVSRTNH
jgi:predicted amidohydrolase